MVKAKEYLQQARKLDRMIRNKTAEKMQWKSVAVGLGSPQMGDKVQSSGNPQKMADAVGLYIDIEKEIDACIKELHEKRKEIIGVIEQLREDEYDLLHKVYIQYMTLDEVAFERQRSRSWAVKVHGIALLHVQDILNGNKKC